MPFPINKLDIADRLRSYPRDHYLNIGAIMKGVSLSVAAVVLAQIFENFRVDWPALAPWAASLGAILVSYMTWGRGVLVTNSRANIGDSLFPLLMGIVEFLVFAVLWQDKDQPLLWSSWFLMIALHGFLASILVNNRLGNSVVSEDFDEETRELGILMEEWMRKDRRGAFFLGMGALIGWAIIKWFLPRYLGSERIFMTQGFLAIPLLAILCKVIFDADSQRCQIDDFISCRLASIPPLSDAANAKKSHE